jgi:hypothetical protein
MEDNIQKLTNIWLLDNYILGLALGPGCCSASTNLIHCHVMMMQCDDGVKAGTARIRWQRLPSNFEGCHPLLSAMWQ